ncbi:hypothetical protein [Hyphomicrobium sp. D-2]|uniref:hypothetical protein n=1 Tax=Hyphomicrobium sp. D-2 TaxID=3041621 RepID=UPI0024589A6C|nr:hypothetical protein [Hyphomicrobium sp. D-2]MDH4983071.1 hypothetical protein [Hyphomicrobium sp. D-2]
MTLAACASLCALALGLVGCSSATAPSLTTQSVAPPRPAQSYEAPHQVGAENEWDASSQPAGGAYRPAPVSPRAPASTASGGRDYEYRGGRDPVTGKAYTQIGAEEEPR